MKTLLSIFGFAALLIFSTATVNAQALTSVFSAEIREDEIREFNGEPSTAFFNIQGDDDAFTVYSLTDFDTTSIGANGTVTGITGITLDLSQSNAGFSADGGLEFFLASDTRVITVNDTARYIQNQPTGNLGADVVGTAFGTLYSLGTGTYILGTDGDVDSSTLSLDAAGEAFAVDTINQGGLLRVIATPADLAVQATYAGSAFPFDPPVAAPVLNLTVTTGGGGTTLKGDVDTDGDVDFSDIPAFIAVLQAGAFQAEADCDCSTVVDFGDIPVFITILQNQ